MHCGYSSVADWAALARWGLSGFVARHWGATFPLGYFVRQCLRLICHWCARRADLASEGRMAADSRIFATNFLMYGICGGYTTFSSFSLQTLNLLRA